MRSFAVAVFFSLLAPLAAPAFAAPAGVPWDLARRVIRSADPVAIDEVVNLLDRGAEDAERGAKLMRVIGVNRPQTFAAILARSDLVEAARAAVLAEVARMPKDSEARANLLALANRVPAVDTADRAK